MKVEAENTGQRPSQSRAIQPETTAVVGSEYAPRKLTFAENVILTMKVLAMAGLLVAILWAIGLWTDK
jgi:hypothetical protein